ncbi:cation diffusion facilitator family transporter [Phycicoccus sp. SLBN-51]|uniref:cation diffusion facilitator family transporter n=1 Tax=Phycicoccus sp. SLBN-51 TaxID=2768447 RepID=UPI00114F7EA7|nr:cation diffusion facilitator family transporter [Phycicoccus sp. SLBN-51]TQJ52152.1 cation diffusion facilitator family transporter [Phycicoccus sp. SLBN-51]
MSPTNGAPHRLDPEHHGGTGDHHEVQQHDHGQHHQQPDDHDHDHDHEHSGGLWGRVRHALTPHSHDTTESLDSALESSARGIRAVKISLVGLGVTAALQLVIVVASGSVALLADTIHNFSDAFTAVPLWVAFLLGRRTATRRYTYGYGRAEDLAGLFVIAMIAMSAVVAGWEAIDRLLNPAPVDHLGWVAVAGFLGFLGNEAVAVFRIREGRAIGSAALVADGHHARTDGLTSLAVLVGAAGVAIGWNWADPVVGLVITVMIVLVLRTTARDVFQRLMDGIEPEHLRTAEDALAAVPGVEAVQQVRMRWIGHQIHADALVEVDPGLSLKAAHQVAHCAEGRLVDAVPRLTHAAIRTCPREAGRPEGPVRT